MSNWTQTERNTSPVHPKNNLWFFPRGRRGKMICLCLWIYNNGIYEDIKCKIPAWRVPRATLFTSMAQYPHCWQDDYLESEEADLPFDDTHSKSTSPAKSPATKTAS